MIIQLIPNLDTDKKIKLTKKIEDFGFELKNIKTQFT